MPASAKGYIRGLFGVYPFNPLVHLFTAAVIQAACKAALSHVTFGKRGTAPTPPRLVRIPLAAVL